MLPNQKITRLLPCPRVPSPTESGECDAPSLVERHTFSCEQVTLDEIITGLRTPTHFTLRVDHPVPGNVAVVWQVVQSVPYLTRVARQPRKRGHLTIGSYTALGNSTYDLVYAFIGFVGRHGLFEFDVSLNDLPQREPLDLEGRLGTQRLCSLDRTILECCVDRLLDFPLTRNPKNLQELP